MIDIAPEKPQYRPRGRPFVKGQSGNPAGRQKGCRNKATRLAELYLDGEAEGLLRKSVELAYAGSALHMKLVLDRTVPPRRERPTPFRLPPIERPADLAPAMDAVLAAASRGVITRSQAVELAMGIAARVRADGAAGFDRSLTWIELGDTRG